MRKVVIISGVLGVLAVSGAACAAAVWYRHNLAADVAPSAGGSIALGTVPAGPDVTAKSTAVASGLQVQSGSVAKGVVSGTTNTQHLPVSEPVHPSATPGGNEFSQYEQYKSSESALFVDLVAGTGPVADTGKQLAVNYRGWLTNGQEFDESYARGKPFVFILGAHQVIAGWEEGLAGMRVGGKRRLVVPPAVGYGGTTTGSIPANSVLVFDVELVSVQ